MTVKYFLVLLLCVCLIEITSNTLLERVKRVCRQAAENWKLINLPSKKPFFKKAPFIRRKFRRPLISKIELIQLEEDEAISEFETEEEPASVNNDDVFTNQKDNTFKPFHKLHKIEELEEKEFEETEAVYYDDFEDSDELYDITDIYNLNENTIDNVYYCNSEDKN